LDSDYRLRTLKRSTVAIASVVLVELFLGLAVSSLAIVSDGLHALLDALTTLMLFVATRMATKPPDEQHMYGHEKYESIGGFVGGIALVGIALLIVYEAILKILSSQTVNLGIEYIGFVAIGYTFCIDFFRVGTFMRAQKGESTSMKAGYYHALADLSSTVIAFVGFGLAALGFNVGDSLASMVLGVLLTYLSVKLVWNSGMELTDTVSKDLADKVRKGILETKEVCTLKDLKIRKAGDKTFARATLQVPDYMGHEEAHGLASEVEAKIKSIIGSAEVAIHTEPCETHMPTSKLVEKLAKEVRGVKDVHEVNAAYTKGKLYITLHAYVDPKLSIEEAHEIAENIEKEVGRHFGNAEDIMVHIEPSIRKRRKGTVVDEDEVRRVVHQVADNYQRTFRIKGIVTYVTRKERYINVDCVLSKQVSVEEAHKIASEIEGEIGQHFSETTVTVHMEPSQVT
jgi:cation diffusion facilitator family transporter